MSMRLPMTIVRAGRSLRVSSALALSVDARDSAVTLTRVLSADRTWAFCLLGSSLCRLSLEQDANQLRSQAAPLRSATSIQDEMPPLKRGEEVRRRSAGTQLASPLLRQQLLTWPPPTTPQVLTTHGLP